MRIRLRPPTDLHKSVKPQRPTRYGPSRQLTRQFGGQLAETGRVDVLYYFGPYVYRSTSARMREPKGRMSRPTAEWEFWGRGETRAVGLGNAVNFPGDPEIRGCVCGKVFTARCYACAVLAMGLCLSVCHNFTSRCSTQHHTIAQGLCVYLVPF